MNLSPKTAFSRRHDNAGPSIGAIERRCKSNGVYKLTITYNGSLRAQNGVRRLPPLRLRLASGIPRPRTGSLTGSPCNARFRRSELSTDLALESRCQTTTNETILRWDGNGPSGPDVSKPSRNKTWTGDTSPTGNGSWDPHPIPKPDGNKKKNKKCFDLSSFHAPTFLPPPYHDPPPPSRSPLFPPIYFMHENGIIYLQYFFSEFRGSNPPLYIPVFYYQSEFEYHCQQKNVAFQSPHLKPF